jgi:hypothetical protein
MSLNFREVGSVLLSVSGYCYHTLIDERNKPIEVIELQDKEGEFDEVDTDGISAGRKIVAEIAFIPLVALAGIETIVRSALYLLLSPAIVGFFVYYRDKEMSFLEGIATGAMGCAVLEGVQVSILAASVKALYRNIFDDALPGVARGAESDYSAGFDFALKELTCGYLDVK